MAKVTVPAEDLMPGPLGYRVHVVDFDTHANRYHGSHRLPDQYEKEPGYWREGSKRILTDRRFHAQNVYALVMKTLARFEYALGRRLGWSFENHQLKIAPHGMCDANAFYSPTDEGLVFGYFEVKEGQPVYTALSHDVVVHETAHALLDSLRARYLVPSNPDQAAFHEGFSDVVALLSVFALPEIVAHLIKPEGGEPELTRRQVSPEALRQSALFGLADEMGQALSGIRGDALRKSAQLEPSARLLEEPAFLEPHRRGEIFAAAVMQGFINAWSARIVKLGTSRQNRYPLMRAIEEGADIADALLTFWIRAIDYMPPAHLTFQDALTAALTADTRLRPDDSRFSLRHHMKASFAAFGIVPASTTNDCWAAPPANLSYDRVRFESMRSDKDEVFRFIWDNRYKLEIETDAYTKVISVRPCTRIGLDGFVLHETVAEYYQIAKLTRAELTAKKIKAPKDYLRAIARQQAERLAKRQSGTDDDEHQHDAENGAAGEDDDDATTTVYGGGTLIFDEYGRLVFHIKNSVFGSRQSNRLEHLWQAGLLRVRDGESRFLAARLSTLHRLRAIDAQKSPMEGW